MDATYLIFERHTATRVSLVRATSLTDAVCAYIAERTEEDIVLQPDGSLRVIGQSYPHPLAFIEALFKVDSEWQIRRLPEWAGASHTVTEFWGEDARYPAEMIKQCRPTFRKAFPRNRAKAFAWFLEQGTIGHVLSQGQALPNRCAGALPVELENGNAYHHRMARRLPANRRQPHTKALSLSQPKPPHKLTLKKHNPPANNTSNSHFTIRQGAYSPVGKRNCHVNPHHAQSHNHTNTPRQRRRQQANSAVFCPHQRLQHFGYGR